MKKSIAVPNNFSFRGRTIGDFEKALEVFDWDIQDTQIAIDFSSVRNANYQTLALFALFAWHLRLQRCRIDFKFGPDSGIGKMWYRIGLPGWSQVLFAEEDFKHHPYKPLIAIRSQHGFNLALGAAEAFAESFDVEYQFLSSLMADPIRRSGIAAYKQLKFVNADPVIRETVDYILDENTAMPGAD